MRRDETTLLDTAKAARLVIAFVQGLGKEEFLGDIKTQSSVPFVVNVSWRFR